MNLRVLLITTALAASGAGAIGCSGSTESAGLPATAVVNPPDGGTDDGAITFPSPGANASFGPAAPMKPPSQPQIEGSPLCNASGWMGCYPDNAKTPKGSDCGGFPDGRGNDSGAGSDTPSACHVQRADAGVQPVCTGSGSSTDGMPCDGPTDCAPGFECVANGRCQPYCCRGECSQSNEFCDIQPTAADSALKVPVCMPVQSCGLLDSDGGACPSDATCAVVRADTGTTGCVAIGPRQAGDECNTSNCARGLTCLGTPGERTCYILCHTGQRTQECAQTPKQTCKGGIPLFPAPGIGICE
ncbi:MAG: hypothetical protein WBY94_10110 [Polyangiaceae bacterium]